MKGNWLFQAVFAFLVFSAQSAEASGVLSCLIHSFRAEALGEKYTPKDRDLHIVLYDPAYGFSKNRKIQDRAFELFTENESPQGVIVQFFRRDPATLSRALEQLETMPELARSEVLKEPQRTQLFWSEIDPPHSAQDIISPVKHKRAVYAETDLKEAQAIQAQLMKIGVKTKIVPGKTFKDSSNGKALIQIIQVKGTKSPTSMKSGKSVFKSSEFNAYLEKAEQQNGIIFIDPGLLHTEQAAAYFIAAPIVPGKAWSIGLRPDTIWSHFIHEWEHKMDRIDRNNVFEDAVYSKSGEKKTNGGVWKRTMVRAGRDLEKSHISELNATAAQFRLYFKTVSAKPGDLLNVIIYRASNQRKVAVGRLLQDPFNPSHYILYLRSRIILYGTLSSLYLAPNLVLERILKEMNRQDWEEEWKFLKCGSPSMSPSPYVRTSCRVLGEKLGKDK